MTDTFFQNIPTPMSNDNVISLPECADIEARLEAAVAANPHCPNNIFLRRRALVIPEGPSGLPEAMVLLRTSVQIGNFEGPVIAACRARMRGPESGYVIWLYGTPQNLDSFGPNSVFYFVGQCGQCEETLFIRNAKELGEEATFHDALLKLNEAVLAFTVEQVTDALAISSEGLHPCKPFEPIMNFGGGI